MKLIRVKCKDESKEHIVGLKKLLAYTQEIIKKNKKNLKAKIHEYTIIVQEPNGQFDTIVAMEPSYASFVGSAKNFKPIEFSEAKNYIKEQLNKIFKGKSVSGWKRVNGQWVREE